MERSNRIAQVYGYAVCLVAIITFLISAAAGRVEVLTGRGFRNNRLALAGHEEEMDSTRRGVAAVVRLEKRYFVKDAILDL